jgi:FMN phosphatase YigB (HAD superfamily)
MKKLVVFDLDGTLAASKSPLDGWSSSNWNTYRLPGKLDSAGRTRL